MFDTVMSSSSCDKLDSSARSVHFQIDILDAITYRKFLDFLCIFTDALASLEPASSVDQHLLKIFRIINEC